MLSDHGSAGEGAPATVPMLFKTAGCQQKWTSGAFLPHHIKLDRILYAYDALAAKTLALKVIIEAWLG